MSIWSTRHEISVLRRTQYGQPLCEGASDYGGIDIADSGMSDVIRLTTYDHTGTEEIDLYITPDEARLIAAALNHAAGSR